MKPRRYGAAADPAAQAEFQERTALLKEQDRQDFVELMRHPWGRRFIYRLVYGRCLVDSEVYAPSGQEMARNEGKRKVGIEMKAYALEHCPELWVEAVREQTLAAAEFLKGTRQLIDDARKGATQ